MPFDLFVRSLTTGNRVAAGELEHLALPLDSVVKEITGDAYRDRYAIVSGRELEDMILRLAPEVASSIRKRIGAACGGRLERDAALILHWEEWESGY